jgi:hypothetical protein
MDKESMNEEDLKKIFSQMECPSSELITEDVEHYHH